MRELAHIMLDLETMGTVAGCAILSIGAVRFFPQEKRLSDTFYTTISAESCALVGLHIDEQTETWWADQAEEARKILEEVKNPQTTYLRRVLVDLNIWLTAQGESNDLRIYGNGADFDNPILRVAYRQAGVKPYAGNWTGRCYRTLKTLDELLGPGFAAPKLKRSGTHHNALDDAVSQAQHLMEFIAALRVPQKEDWTEQLRRRASEIEDHTP